MGIKHMVEGLVSRDRELEGDAFYRVTAGPVPPDFAIPEELKELTDVQRLRTQDDPVARKAECPACFGMKTIPTKYGAKKCDFCSGTGEALGLVKLVISETIPRPGEMTRMMAEGREVFPVTNKFAKAVFAGERPPFPVYHCLLVRPESHGTKYKGSATIWMRPDGGNLQRREDRTLGDVMIAYHAIAARVERTQGEFSAYLEYTAPMEGGVISEQIGMLSGEAVENPDSGKKEWRWTWKLLVTDNFVRNYEIAIEAVVEKTIDLGLCLTGWEPK
jgi:hypothetical protein